MVDSQFSLPLAISVAAAFLAGYLLALSVGKREMSLEEKLKRYTAWNPPPSNMPRPYGFQEILARLADLAPSRWTEGINRSLQQAGIPLKGGEFLVVQAVVSLLLSLCGLLLGRSLVGAIAGAAMGFFSPRIWLGAGRKRRRRQFDNQLADSLLILANSLRAGFSLLQAMEMVSQEMPNPISSEFRLTLREMTYGASTEVALTHLAERVDSQDLDLLVTAVLIQRQVGGNLSEVLLNIHSTINDRLRIQQELKTLTAQSRTSGYIIAGLPFGIAGVLAILNRDYLMLLVTHRLGWLMLAAGLCAQATGFALIRRIVSIKY